MIKLFKNLWKFIKGEKGPNYSEPCKKERTEEQLAAEKEFHRQAIYARLNSRGKRILDDYSILDYNHLVFMTVPGFKELDRCGQKTAEHLYGTIQDYINGFDNSMSYLQDMKEGDDWI